MKKIIVFSFIFCCCLLISLPLYAQRFPTGVVIDDALYNSIPLKAEQLSRTYSSMPPSHSLKKYTPVPRSQSESTCVGWAVSYSARSILEASTINRTDKSLNTQNAFSPMFVYKNVRLIYYNDPFPDFRQGIPIVYALEFLKTEGTVRMPYWELTTSLYQLQLSQFTAYRRYPIAGFARLFPGADELDDDSVRTKAVKRSIAEGKPVVVSLKIPLSFHSVNSDVWQPYENPASIPRAGNSHAITVIGYDDKKYGGAFEIQNSWGTDWANDGFVWIPYSVFNRWANEAYDLTENFSLYENMTEYSGSVEIELFHSSKQGMPVNYIDGYYQTIHGYPSGTRFRYLIGNNKPAFVYAFASDTGSRVTTRIFPGKGISPLLDFSENLIAFPGEYSWIELDENTGTDYLIVLFAKESLDIDDIQKRFERASGTLPERVSKAVGSNYIPPETASYEKNKIKFSAKSANPKSVFGLLLAINHIER